MRLKTTEDSIVETIEGIMIIKIQKVIIVNKRAIILTEEIIKEEVTINAVIIVDPIEIIIVKIIQTTLTRQK